MLVRFAFAMNVEKHVLLMHTTSASVSRTKRDAAHRQHTAILFATKSSLWIFFCTFLLVH
jgi:hypothetical protein